MNRSITVHDFESFRGAARPLLAAGVKPAEITWLDATDAQESLSRDNVQAVDNHAADGNHPGAASSGNGTGPAPASHGGPAAVSGSASHAAAEGGAVAQAAPRVPRRFVELAELSSLFRSPDRFALLYRVLYRLTHGEHALLEDELDPDVRALQLRAQSVRKDEHRMHAFVRFRKIDLAGQEHFIAWYAPEHHTLRLAAPFFERRFATMRWSILTPDESAHWDGVELQYGPGAPRAQAPHADELESLFRTYYSATYNPARTNLPLFRKHVPATFARHMPELDELPALMQMKIEEANMPTQLKAQVESAAPLVPNSTDLGKLRRAAKKCVACPAGELENQTVFGEGNENAKLCLVGEQPGDEEDKQGRPFVGPAGRVLDKALAEAKVPREELYVTNAVKHFVYINRGKRRIHSKPSLRIVRACKPWLEAEIKAIKPEVVLCLGATAAQSFMGPRFSITKNRGRAFETPWAKSFIVTYHPSAILRMEDGPAEQAYKDLVSDLKLAYSLTHAAAGSGKRKRSSG